MKHLVDKQNFMLEKQYKGGREGALACGNTCVQWEVVACFSGKSPIIGAPMAHFFEEKHPLAKGFKVLWQRIKLKLGQERALLANNADFWGRKELCWRTMPISGAEKSFVGEQCRFLGQKSALWRNNANFWVPESVSPSRSTPTSDRWRDSDFYTEYLSTQF